MPSSNKKYQIFESAHDFYQSMLDDIENAKKYIYLEMYKYSNGEMGIKFRDALTRKCREGVEVKLLIDSWGAYVSQSYFSELTAYGGEVRFFKKIKFFIDFFTKNHRRNHRKILVIDDRITHIGSANIVEYGYDWREAMLRVYGGIAVEFKKVFLQDFKIFNKYVFEKVSYIRTIKYDDLEILRDVPSIARQRVRKRYTQLIKGAKKEIVIETPYFIPGFMLRKALMDAAKRGVNVKVLLPNHSDMRLIDLMRNRYIGRLSKSNVHFLLYMPNNLHGKLILVDREVFVLGSPNFDYRSFRYQHEIALLGRDPEAIQCIADHILGTFKDSESFNYDYWLQRPMIDKLFEWLLVPFRHLL